MNREKRDVKATVVVGMAALLMGVLLTWAIYRAFKTAGTFMNLKVEYEVSR